MIPNLMFLMFPNLMALRKQLPPEKSVPSNELFWNKAEINTPVHIGSHKSEQLLVLAKLKHVVFLFFISAYLNVITLTDFIWKK